MMIPDPSSFRDPDGRVYHSDGRIFRALSPAGADRFRAFEASGLPSEFLRRSQLIGFQPVDPARGDEFGACALLLEHPRVPYISYCYEWSFEMLRSAGLLELELAVGALERGYILKDATPFNVQFFGSHPLHIDVTSFEPWAEGSPWKAYSQFCRMFLNPLLLSSLTGLPFQPLLRGRMEGIPPEELADLLPWWTKLKSGVFWDVALHGWLNRKSSEATAEVATQARGVSISREKLHGLLQRLHRTLRSLKCPVPRSNWVNYEATPSLTPEGLRFKDEFVEKALKSTMPRTVIDLGANTGRYSLLACSYAESILALEQDGSAVDALYLRARSDAPGSKVLPLVANLLDPSPAQGWSEEERPGLLSRGRSEFCLCLALVHHLTVQGNLPLDRFFDWISRITTGGVIEFVPKNDPKMQELLRWREDVFPDYTRERFESELRSRFRIMEQSQISNSSRVLYHFGGKGQ